MAREGVVLLHPVKGRIQVLLRQGPCHQGPLGELGSQQRLAHAAHHSGFHHGFQALDDYRDRVAALLGNGMEGEAPEALDAVFRHHQDVRVDGIVRRGGNAVHDGSKKGRAMVSPGPESRSWFSYCPDWYSGLLSYRAS